MDRGRILHDYNCRQRHQVYLPITRTGVQETGMKNPSSKKLQVFVTRLKRLQKVETNCIATICIFLSTYATQTVKYIYLFVRNKKEEAPVCFLFFFAVLLADRH
mgnify:CR=1 FL=1